MDEIKINKEAIQKNLHLIIIAIASIAGLFMFSPLFNSGVLANIDNPTHLARIWCLDNSGMLPPSSWCAQFQAGFPTSSYYYPIIETFIIFLGKLIGLALAYKIVVATTLFIAAFGAYLLLSTLGKKLAGAFAFALVLFNPGSWAIGGFEETVLVGMWPQVISAGFLFIGLALFIRFLRDPNYKTFALAALSTMLMTHPATLILAAMAYAVIALAMWKESLKNIKWLIGFSSLVVMLNFYYAFPMIFSGKYIFWKTSGTLGMADLKNYVLTKISWYVLAAAALGLILLIKSKIKEKMALIALSLFILINFSLSLIPALDGKWFIGLRMSLFLATIVFILAGLFFEFLSEISFKIEERKIKIGVIVSIILMGIIIYPQAQTSFNYGKSVIIIPEKEISALYSPIKTLPEGRMVIEETLYNAGQNTITFTHLHMFIIPYSGRELVGIPWFTTSKQYLATTEWGNMFGNKLENYTDKEMNRLFTHYNVRYIIAHTPMYINYFINNTKQTKSHAQLGPFVVFETNITPSYFEVKNGEIILENYQKTSGKVSVNMDGDGYVSMKVNPFINWVVYVDGKKANIETCEEIICTKVPKGKHEINFVYKNFHWSNYVGYTVTLLGFGALIALFFIDQKNNRNHKKSDNKIETKAERKKRK